MSSEKQRKEDCMAYLRPENLIENPKLERDYPPLYSQIDKWPPIYMTTDAANLCKKWNSDAWCRSEGRKKW